MRKLTLLIVVFLLSAVAVRAQIAVVNTTALKTALQLKLDEWHKAGSFPGATLGVALADGESFGLAVGFFGSRGQNSDEANRSDAGWKCR